MHKQIFNDGLFSTTNMQALLQKTADELQPAMTCEAARWGDEVTPGIPFNTIDDWLPHVTYLKDTWFLGRNATFLSDLRSNNLYPSIDAPVYSQHGSTIVAGDSITITNPNASGTLYFTTDGSDPRISGGSVSGTAQTYSTPVVLNSNTIVKSRVLLSGEWSALNEASFTTGVAPSANTIVISEIHYNPANPTPAEITAGFIDSDDFEFIELLNISSVSLDLSSLAFDKTAAGIGFDFSTLTSPLLAPGARIVLAKNLGAYAQRYGTAVTPAGVYSGKLSNGGETLTLTQGGSTIHLSFAYNDKYPWPETPDGQGPSLTLFEPTLSPDHSVATNWFSSGQLHGTPSDEEMLPVFPATPNADSDNNGIADIIDYTFTGNTEPASIHLTGDDFITISFRTNPSIDKAVATVQYSEDLVNWTSAVDKVAHVSETYNADGSVTHVWQSLTPMNRAENVSQFLRIEASER